MPPDAQSPEATPRAPIKISKSDLEAPGRDISEADRDSAGPSTKTPQDKDSSETNGKTEDAAGRVDAGSAAAQPAPDANLATEAKTEAKTEAETEALAVAAALAVAQEIAAPSQMSVQQAADMAAVVVQPAPAVEDPVSDAAATQTSDAVVMASGPSVADKAVIAARPAGLPASDTAKEALPQQPATAEVAQTVPKGSGRHEKMADGPSAEPIAGDKGESELTPRAEQPQQAQAMQPAAHRPADGTQLGTLLSNLQAATNPAAPPASLIQPPKPEGAQAHLAKAIPPSAVPIEIGLRALQGAREFQIRLDPAELGRVEVRLEIGDDKSVSAKVVVDRVETLHLLQREAKTLERAFEQAGLKSSDSGIDISLRDHGQQSNQQRGEAFTDEFGARARNAAAAPIVLPADIPVRRSLHVGALDRSI